LPEKPTIDLLTQIGAITGFIAFVLKVWEFYRDRRPALTVQKWLTSDPDRGNTLLILNSSKVLATIYSYSLEGVPRTFGSRVWPRFKGHNIEFHLEDRHANIIVPAYGQYALEFREQDHFDWSMRRKTDLYLRLWIVGRSRSLHYIVAKAGGSRTVL
jgi:hypothetical protein